MLRSLSIIVRQFDVLSSASSTSAAGPTSESLLERAPFIALLAFVAALQVSIAAADVLLGFTLVAWGISLVRCRRRPEVPFMFWPLAAYGALTLVSSVFSADPLASFIDSRQLLLFLIIPAVYDIAAGRRALRVVDVIISVGAASAIVGIVQYGILDFDNLGRRPQGSLGHYMT
jgi:O-antigen ligase